jgi:hypothetical protein
LPVSKSKNHLITWSTRTLVLSRPIVEEVIN